MTDFPSRRRVLGTLAGGILGSLVSGCDPAQVSAPHGRYTAPEPRTRIDLNQGWVFRKGDAGGAETAGFDDSGWAPVAVPHTWNAVDGADGGGYYRGVGWYRRHYQAPADLTGRALLLQFDGVNQVADVWVNGIHLGRHQGGYSRFRFDTTAALLPGRDNVLAVRATNAYDPDIAPLDADYTFDGGMYRDVSLWAVHGLQVQMLDYAGPGVYVRQGDVSAAATTVTVTTKLWNGLGASRSVAVRTVITDATGSVVVDARSPVRAVAPAAGSQVAQIFTISGPHLWKGVADPYLYRVTVEVRDVTAGADTVTDVVTERFGLRAITVNPATGLSLNGEHYRLRGVNLHQDRGGTGWAVSDADRTQDFDLIQEMGATAIRMAHYQHATKDYDLADERGFIVWAEIPLVNRVTDSAAFTASTENQLRELIRQNYNHPSIAFWSIGNEQQQDDLPTNTLLAALAALVTTEDPDRISTYASKSADNAQVALHTRTCGFNRYYGWYTGSKDGDLGAWADALHADSPARTFAVSEYGAGANITQHALNPGKPQASGQFHPEEYQSLFHEAAWRQLAARPYLWGAFVWAMFDYASDTRHEGDQPGINDKGLVTRDRATRKDAFYWYKANWAATPTLYITSRRWTQRTDPVTDLKVYSSADQVTATLNGAPLGTLTGPDRVFTWPNVTLRTGQNTVTVIATINGTLHTDTATWTLDPSNTRKR